MHLATGNSFSKLKIEEGSVYASELDNRMALPANVEFVDGSLYDADNSYSYSNNPANFIVAEGNTGRLYLDSRCAYTGKLTGAGKFIVYANWIRHDLNGDWSGFEGELTAAYRNGEGPDFKWNNDYGMPKATLNIAGGVTFNAQNKNVSLANLKGTGTYLGSGTLTVGNDRISINYPGVFSGNPSIVKTGKCDWTLSKQLKDISVLTARDGTISLTASKSPYNNVFLTAPLKIEGYAKLRGRGTVGDITVSAMGILEPGTYSGDMHYGPIYSKGNVTVNSGATLSLFLRMAGKNNDCSYLDVKGTLKIDGIVKVTMNPDYVPAEGDEFRLWIADNFNGNPTFELPQLPENLKWDYSGLSDATGILRIEKSTGIDTVQDRNVKQCLVYDIYGTFLGAMETSQSKAIDDFRMNFFNRKGIFILRFVSGNYSNVVKIKIE